MATDQHSVNVLLSKWAVAEQRRQDQEEEERRQEEAERIHADSVQTGVDASFHIPLFCIQHKTGSAVEGVSETLGLISPAFCIASALQWGNVADGVDALLLDVIQQDLQCPETPPALSAAAAGQTLFVKELLDECYVNDVQQDTDKDEDAQRRGVEQRKAHAHELVDFFWGPWSGPMVHVCRGANCCPRGRPDSVQRAFTLLKGIVAPPISRRLPSTSTLRWTP